MAALSSFIVMCNDRYAHDCKDRVADTRWRRPWIRVPQRTAWCCAVFVGKRYGSKGYPPCGALRHKVHHIHPLNVLLPQHRDWLSEF